jgi:hypothetical protein
VQEMISDHSLCHDVYITNCRTRQNTCSCMQMSTERDEAFENDSRR